MTTNERSGIRDRVESVEHWELLTLMIVTGVTILGFYLAVLYLLHPLVDSLVGGVAVPVYLVVTLALTVLLSWVAMRWEIRQKRSAYDPLTPDLDPKLHSSVEELCSELGMPTPDVYIVPDENLNAHANGTRWNGVVALTDTAYDELPHEELEALLAHELTHLYYCDSAVSTVALYIESVVRRVARTVAVVVNTMLLLIFAVVYSAGEESETQRDARRRHRLHRLLQRTIVGATTLPVLVSKNALSRYREFVADSTAAQLTGPEPTIELLERLPTHRGTDGDSRSISNVVETKLGVVYATHPSLERRIGVLEEDFTEADDTPGPLDEGATLGSFTKFGLTVAPITTVGMLLAFFAVLAFGAPIDIESAGLAGGIVALVVLVFAVIWFAGLFAFSWAMLFADGGHPAFGVVSVACLGLSLSGGALDSSTMFFVGYVGLTAVAALHLSQVVSALS